jgi:hypothetical protein
MTDRKDKDGQDIILNIVDNAIISNPSPIKAKGGSKMILDY